MFVSPQKLYVTTLQMINVMEFGDGAFGRWLDHEGGALMDRISAVIKETPASCLVPATK